MADVLVLDSGELKDAEKLNRLIQTHESFQVVGIKDMSSVVRTIETAIEKQGLKVRVYTEYRAAAMAGIAVPIGITQVAALATAATTAVHNLATFNPDYEIAKNKPMSRVTVTYKKDV